MALAESRNELGRIESDFDESLTNGTMFSMPCSTWSSAVDFARWIAPRRCDCWMVCEKVVGHRSYVRQEGESVHPRYMEGDGMGAARTEDRATKMGQ